MEWQSMGEWAKAVYRAHELGIIDPRLERVDQGDCYFTQEQLDCLERWADELLAEELVN